jgi:hypothetical protein
MVLLITFGELGPLKRSSVGFAELGSKEHLLLLRKGYGGRSSVAFCNPDACFASVRTFGPDYFLIRPYGLWEQIHFNLSNFVAPVPIAIGMFLLPRQSQ